MYTMWDAPSDRDYYDQFDSSEPYPEDPENVVPDELRQILCEALRQETDDACPF